MTRVGVAVGAAATVLYLAFVVPQLNRPLMYDDANFALGIKATAETGVPFGNQGWMSERGDFSQREQWALWHPPLYIYTAAVFTRVLGWTPEAMRLVGVLGGLAIATLTYVLARDLTRAPPQARAIAAGSAVALTMLSPIVVQSTLIVDIDFSILLPLTLLWLWLYLRLEGSARQWLWLAPLFGLLLWTKMTNPLPLIGIIGVWQLLRGRWLRAILHPAVIGVGGAVVFAITWIAIGSLMRWPLDMPFGVNQVQWQDSAEVARRAYTSPGAFIDGLQPSVLWLGPGLVALGLAGVAVRGAQLARCWQFRNADLLTGLLIVFVLGYVNKSAGWFPKYQVALAPLLACLAAPLIAQAWCLRPRLTLSVAAVATIASGVATLRLGADDWALQRTWHIEDIAGAWLFGILVAAAVLGVRAFAATTLAGLIALGFGWSLALDLRQLRAPYQTDYWYGTTGVIEAANWVDSHLQPDQTYVASKEVAIRSRDLRYVDQENLVYFLSIGRSFDGTWAGEQVHAMVTWQREAYAADLMQRAVGSAQFQETARFGDYVIYEPIAGS